MSGRCGLPRVFPATWTPRRMGIPSLFCSFPSSSSSAPAEPGRPFLATISVVEKSTQRAQAENLPETATSPLPGQPWRLTSTSPPVLATGTLFKVIELNREFRETEARIWPALAAPSVSPPYTRNSRCFTAVADPLRERSLLCATGSCRPTQNWSVRLSNTYNVPLLQRSFECNSTLSTSDSSNSDINSLSVSPTPPKSQALGLGALRLASWVKEDTGSTSSVRAALARDRTLGEP